jgi:hypothetical protein
VLAQLGNRVQHALRAFTPHDQKAVKAAAETLRPNPAFEMTKAITELSIGEALVSFLDSHGSPGVTERAWILPPSSRIGPLTDAERDAIRKSSAAVYGHYEQTVDRESAYEKLHARTAEKTGSPPAPSSAPASRGPAPTAPSSGAGGFGAAATGAAGALSAILLGSTGPRGGHHDGLLDSAARSAARSIGSSVGRAILRGTLGSILGGKR